MNTPSSALGARDLAYNFGFAWISKVANPKFRDGTGYEPGLAALKGLIKDSRW
jgi:hypothetical protein